MSNQQPSAPSTMRVGELLDAAIKLTRRHFAALAGAVLVVIVITQVLSTALTLASQDDTTAVTTFGLDSSGQLRSDTDGTLVGVAAVLAVVSVLSYALSQLACFRILAEGHLGREVTAGESLRWATSRILPGIAVSLLFAIFVGIGIVLFVLPGIYLAVALSLAFPVLLVERLGPLASLGRSRRLVSGFWWPTLGRFLVAVIIVFVLQAVIGGILGALFGTVVDGDSTGGIIISGVVNGLVQLVTTPFLAAVTVLIYFDLRVRKEGFDLAMLAEELGGPGATEPARDGRGGGDGATDAFGRPAGAGGWSGGPASSPPREPDGPRTPPSPPPGWAPPSSGG